jgi:hypothetical protein
MRIVGTDIQMMVLDVDLYNVAIDKTYSSVVADLLACLISVNKQNDTVEVSLSCFVATWVRVDLANL